MAVSAFEVTCIFCRREEKDLWITAKRGVTEEYVVLLVFARLSRAELDELVSIRLYQARASVRTLEPWLTARRGRFYFNARRCKSPDTRRWASLRDEMLAARPPKGAPAAADVVAAAAAILKSMATPGGATTRDDG